MNKASVIFAIVLLASCCSHRETVVARSRSVDTVSELRSVRSRQLDGETVWTTIILRPDTLGNLHEVERQVTRKTVTETETVADTTVTSSAVAEKEMAKVEETTEKAQSYRGNQTGAKVTLATLAVVFFGLFVFVFFKYLQQRWMNRH